MVRFNYGLLGTYPAGEMVELIRTADELGFHACHLADDPSTRDCWLVAAAAARETSSIRLGFSATHVYLREPTLIAQALATLDELSNGRAEAVVSFGDPNILDAYHVAWRGQRPLARVREALHVMRTYLDHGKVEHDGDFFHYSGVETAVRPIQEHLPLLVGALGGPRSFELAGEVADGVECGSSSRENSQSEGRTHPVEGDSDRRLPHDQCMRDRKRRGRESMSNSNQRTHYVTTTDGVTIGGTVHGQGPPLVFLHAVIGDGDLDWQALLPHVTGRFTCHLPSGRGRGLSGDHPDVSPSRLVDDVLAYVDSIGEATGLVGWGGGAGLALTAAAQSDAVNAVAPVEPLMPSVMDEQDRAGLGDTLARMIELAAEGDLTAAVRAFAGFVLNDEEVAVLEDAGYLEAAGRYVPNLLSLFQQSMEYEGPTEEDPALLGAISTPVLVLHGSDTKSWFIASARYVADHVPKATVQEIPGAGLASPLTHPEALAEALTEFFSPAQ